MSKCFHENFLRLSIIFFESMIELVKTTMKHADLKNLHFTDQYLETRT